jgi:HSP20 family protein
MTKVKKSFFEKLTGARQMESMEPNEYIPERNIHPTTNIFQEETENDIVMESSVRTREENSFSPISPSANEDGEGQLTIDVYQTDNDIVIKSTIAGVKPEDLDVSINSDMVTIRGERKNEEQISDENYYYQECYWGSFSRSVILPIDVVSEKAEASMKNGILTIRLPKADNTRTKKIQVRGF